MRITPILLCLVLGVWSAGCGGTQEADAPGGTSNNGATDNSTNNANDGSPDLPAPPAPPVLTSWDCPDGWLSVPAFEAGSIEGIEPYNICRPPPLPEDCPLGSMALVGHAECVQQGLACPEGDDWHDEATIRSRAEGFDGRIWYVSPQGDDDTGDGTRQAPLATIDEAMTISSSGHILALGVRQFDESIEIYRSGPVSYRPASWPLHRAKLSR
jgi:hypothetical protein